MSFIPCALSGMSEELCRPSHIFDQNFGLGLFPDDLIHPRSTVRLPMPMPMQTIRGYYRPWRFFAGKDSGISNIVSNDNEFKVNLDVQQFHPDNLSVKVVDNTVLIEGKHEERQDEHGFISRQFTRKYVLPDNVDPATVVSNLSSDGVLSISAPKKTPALSGRVVPIVQTNQPAVKPTKAADKAGGDTEKLDQ